MKEKSVYGCYFKFSDSNYTDEREDNFLKLCESLDLGVSMFSYSDKNVSYIRRFEGIISELDNSYNLDEISLLLEEFYSQVISIFGDFKMSLVVDLDNPKQNEDSFIKKYQHTNHTKKKSTGTIRARKSMTDKSYKFLESCDEQLEIVFRAVANYECLNKYFGYTISFDSIEFHKMKCIADFIDYFFNAKNEYKMSLNKDNFFSKNFQYEIGKIYLRYIKDEEPTIENIIKICKFLFD